MQVNEESSTLVSGNLTILGRRTSVRLEPAMWTALRTVARKEQCTIHDIGSLICLKKPRATSLTAAIRVFLMLYYKASATEEGHRKAGHGDFNAMARRAGLTGPIPTRSQSLQQSDEGSQAKLQTSAVRSPTTSDHDPQP